VKPQPRLTTTYVFADGHAVQLFEKHDPDCGPLEFAVVTEQFTRGACSFTGRLTIGRFAGGLTGLLRDALNIRAKTPSVENGSDNTRLRNIAVGYLIVTTKDGDIIFNTMPDLISAPFSHQAEDDIYAERFDPNLTKWGHCRVSKVISAKVQPARVQPASPLPSPALCSTT